MKLLSPKAGAIGLAAVTAVVISGVALNAHTRTSQQPLTVDKPAAATATPTDTAAPAATSASSAAAPTPVPTSPTNMASTSGAPAPAPTPIFQASSSEYPGSGRFNLPEFTPSSDWSITYSYSCDQDYVRISAVLGTSYQVGVHYSSVPPSTSDSGTSGPLGYHNTVHFALYIPDGSHCTWTVAANTVS